MHTLDNLLAFSPELWLLAGAIVVLALGRLGSQARLTIVVAFVALVGAFVALMTQLKSTLLILSGAFLLDGYARFFDVLFLVTAGLALLMTLTYPLGVERPSPEFPAFVLLATLGAMLAASSAEMVSLFISLEVIGVSIALMTVLLRQSAASAQAGITYLVSGITGSALLLYGLALTYGLSGETNLKAVGSALAHRGSSEPALLLALVLLLAAFALKLGVVPFHWWVPDTYQGAPLPVAAFASSTAVGAGFAVFTRLFQSVFAPTLVAFPVVLAVLAAVTMTFGSLAAVRQTSIRRLLAYVTIGQVGYGLAAVAALKHGGLNAILLFVLALAVANLAAFWALLVYSQAVDTDRVAELAGMSTRAPRLALVMAVSLASLIGVPPLIGFFGKLFVVQAAVAAGFAWLAVIAVLNTTVLAWCCLGVIRIAYFEPPVFDVLPIRLERTAAAGLGLTVAAVVALGALLGPLYAAASAGVSALSH